MKQYYERYWEDKEVLGDFQYKWPILKNYIPKNSKKKILDFGCGKGVVFSELIKMNPSGNITGVDVSNDALIDNRKKFKSYSFKLIKDGGKLPFPSNTFDFILALDVLEHVYDTENAFSELARVLKKGGQILISVPYHGLVKNVVIALFFFEFIYDPYTPHIRSYTKKSLKKCLTNVNLKVKNHGYYGKIYPLSSGMYMLAQK